MNTEFNWWLLIVGLAIGAGLVWLVLLDSRRREDEVTAAERATESVWLADLLADAGTPLSPAVVRRVLDLHGEYLAMAPPDAGAMSPEPAEGTSVEADPGAALDADPAPQPSIEDRPTG